MKNQTLKSKMSTLETGLDLSPWSLYMNMFAKSIVEFVHAKLDLLVTWNLLTANSQRLTWQKSLNSNLHATPVNSTTKYVGLLHVW